MGQNSGRDFFVGEILGQNLPLKYWCKYFYRQNWIPKNAPKICVSKFLWTKKNPKKLGITNLDENT